MKALRSLLNFARNIFIGKPEPFRRRKRPKPSLGLTESLERRIM
jgi:hypothetical protein